MVSTHKTLAELNASDIMSTEVVVVPEDMSLRRAAQLFTREQISGAPVVSASGRCVGVLSATDFFRRTAENADVLPTDKVGVYMTADPVTVSPDTPARQLARMMLDAHIHRVVVVDRDYKPVGVVSSTDILAVMAYGADER